jgi:hypothetical protein
MLRMFPRMLLVLLLWLYHGLVQATDNTIMSWRDEQGVMHYSDGSRGITEEYQPAPDRPDYAKAPERPSRATTRSHSNSTRATTSNTDSSMTTKPLVGECEWLRGRIATLRRLTRGNPDSAFNDELDRRQSEWKKEQCQRGTHVVNRELKPVRKVKIKT